jgi:hypothetical protein
MLRTNYIAVHTYLSEDAKNILQTKPDDRPEDFTDKDWCKMMTFEKAQCMQMWMGLDDFFFCHWSAESEQDVHDCLDSVGAGMMIQTVCYEAKRFASFYKQTGERLVYIQNEKKMGKKKKKKSKNK